MSGRSEGVNRGRGTRKVMEGKIERGGERSTKKKGDLPRKGKIESHGHRVLHKCRLIMSKTVLRRHQGGEYEKKDTNEPLKECPH